MKSLFLLVFVLVCTGIANAEVYVLTNSKGEILSAIEKDVAVVEDGMIRTVLPGKLNDYGLTRHPTYYKLVGKDLVQNNEKISTEANAKQESDAKSIELSMVEKKMRLMACLKLQEEGVVFKKIKCEDFEK
jgi:hypothetical protein